MPKDGRKLRKVEPLTTPKARRKRSKNPQRLAAQNLVTRNLPMKLKPPYSLQKLKKHGRHKAQPSQSQILLFLVSERNISVWARKQELNPLRKEILKQVAHQDHQTNQSADGRLRRKEEKSSPTRMWFKALSIPYQK